jgi:predicted CxxxxCH...CXXCH cytochrome family protein
MVKTIAGLLFFSACTGKAPNNCSEGFGMDRAGRCVPVVSPYAASDESEAPPVNDPSIEGDMPGECSDAADNNQDGLFDCADPGCADDPACDVETDVPEDTGDEVERYHPQGYAGARLHGPETNDRVEDCMPCHGDDLRGMSGPFPETEMNCDDCHEGLEDWRSNCTYCHGGEANTTGAPPREINALEGESESTWSFLAHSIHVEDTEMKTGIGCEQCHVKPDDVFSLGHVLLGDATAGVSEVVFTGGVNPEASWEGGTCSELYCHGDGQEPNGEIAQDAGERKCEDCHAIKGYGASEFRSMSGEHELHLDLGVDLGCPACHSEVMSDPECTEGGSCITDNTLHVNNHNDVHFLESLTTTMEYDPTAQTCSEGGFNCHGPKPWIVTPGSGPGPGPGPGGSK